MGLLVWQGSWILAAFVLWVAIATDIADGLLARRLGAESNLGGLLDHSSDAIFVTATLVGLTNHSLIPIALPFCVVLAFLQYMFDSRSLLGKPLRASRLGQYNGICYFVLGGFPIMQFSLQIFVFDAEFFFLLGWGLVLTTVISMLDRLITLLSPSTLNK